MVCSEGELVDRSRDRRVRSLRRVGEDSKWLEVLVGVAERVEEVGT